MAPIVLVTLPWDVVQRCWDTAKERERIKTTRSDRRICDKPGAHVHFYGLKGEAAVAELAGDPSLVSYSVTKVGDSGCDLLLAGLKIQVKASTYRPPYARFDKVGNQQFTADGVVVCRASGQSLGREHVEVWGWLDREEFFDTCHDDDFGHGMKLVREPPFRPIDDLLEMHHEWRATCGD